MGNCRPSRPAIRRLRTIPCLRVHIQRVSRHDIWQAHSLRAQEVSDLYGFVGQACRATWQVRRGAVSSVGGSAMTPAFPRLLRLLAKLGVPAVLALTLGGCHVLLLFPCIVMPCGYSVVSIPPRNDLFSRALQQGHDLDGIETTLTSMIQSQYDALERRWPARPQCDRIASVGCSYSIAVEVFWQEGLAPAEPRGCALLEITVIDGPTSLPEARRTGYRPMRCPEKPLTSVGDAG